VGYRERPIATCGTPPGWAILPRLSTAHRRGRGHAGTPTAAVAKSERLRGAVGALGQGGVFVAADPVWRSVAPSCANAVDTVLRVQR